MTDTVQLVKQAHILVADEVWVALAMLHRKHPQRASFSAKEILGQVKLEGAYPELRAGVQAHIYLHNVANLDPNSARYRLLYKLADDTYRLYRPGDAAHPLRKGKTAPHRAELPEHYHPLLDWYESEYSGETQQKGNRTSWIDEMWGLGKDIWAGVDADEYVNSLREDWEPQRGPREEQVWQRITEHQGDEFRTITGLPFTYEIDGNSGIWFYRDRRRIEKRLGRHDVDKAIRRCPLTNTVEIRDCFDPAYLFALLMDSRIRGTDW
jgi:hypothetical protein